MAEPFSEAAPSLTELGNPRKPQGEAGAQMLAHMNESHAAVTAWGLSFLALTPADRVLDIGCGGGAALARIAETVTQGHLTGVDYSAVSVESASKCNATHIAEGRMEIVQGNVSALPFPDAAFDKICTVESFYFWDNPAEDLREVRRVLAAGGRFVLIADIYGGAALSQHDLDNIARYGLYNPAPETFRQLLENAGFDDVQVHLREGTTWICAEGNASAV
ncbi:MAG TPA: methyltransferase [Ruminococcus sp.]|nr:methyltransferase [Ruminococcus sp.]